MIDNKVKSLTLIYVISFIVFLVGMWFMLSGSSSNKKDFNVVKEEETLEDEDVYEYRYTISNCSKIFSKASEMASYIKYTEEELDSNNWIANIVDSGGNVKTIYFSYKYNPHYRVLRDVCLQNPRFDTNGLKIYTTVTESKFDYENNVLLTDSNFYKTSDQGYDPNSLYNLYEIRDVSDSKLLGYYAKIKGDNKNGKD